MSETALSFQQDEGPVASPATFWPALVVTGEEIEREVARLAGMAKPANGVRKSYVVHPSSTEPGRALTPGMDAAINVVLPGETTRTMLQNASEVGFCIRGSGVCHAGSRTIPVAHQDVWNIPSMTVCNYENTGTEPFVFLSYSNAPLLKKLGVHYVLPDPVVAPKEAGQGEKKAAAKRAKDSATNAPVGPFGARVLGYEHLIDIDVIPSEPLLWPWAEVSQHLDGVEHLGGEAGRGYQGRHLVVLYNPATERRNGTTQAFFASIAQFPPNRVDAPHRHSSAAINYIFAGSGRSTVEGKRFSWKAGGLMLSAPGWAVHNHASGEDGCNILTIQDHPLHIAQESLIWQEQLKGHIVKLGAEAGFETNVEHAAAAE
jgi:gentisate 1,2-dioxygenase